VIGSVAVLPGPLAGSQRAWAESRSSNAIATSGREWAPNPSSR
jgi:hypothetical protein